METLHFHYSDEKLTFIIKILFKCHISHREILLPYGVFYYFSGTSKVDSTPLGLAYFFTHLYLEMERKHHQEAEGLSFRSNRATVLCYLGNSPPFLEIEVLHLSEGKVKLQIFFFSVCKILCFREHLATYCSLYFISV